MPLDFADLEKFYEDLALALDSVAETDRELFLCKLCLMFAREAGDPDLVHGMIQSAQAHLARS